MDSAPLDFSAVGMIEGFAKASGTMSDTDRARMGIACAAGKEMLRRGVESFLESAHGCPVLTSKSCDGTPMAIKHRTSRALPSGRKIRSSGKHGVEFLVKNQFFKAYLPSGETATRVLLAEPVALTYGKGVDAILTASRKDWVSLREAKHSGICIEHYVWDRLSIQALERKTKLWHLAQPHDHLPASVSPELGRLTEMVLVTPCALHDCQNGFKWALLAECTDADLLRDLYISVESLRNSHDLISAHVGHWLWERLKRRPDQGPEWVQLQCSLWEALGVDLEVAGILASDLQFEFKDGTIWIWEEAEFEGDLGECIEAALMSVWRFVKFSETRWLTVGSSARTVAAAILTGIDDLVACIFKDPRKVMKFYLKGFKRLKLPHRQFVVRAALISRVAEGVQLELMRDSRVATRYEALWKVATKSMKWLADIELPLWDLLGGACGLAGDALRSHVLAGAHTTYHFIWRRVLSVASELPWRLARGDIDANLSELIEEDCPEETTSAQIWQLLHMKYNRPQLIQAVRLIGEIPWTSLTAEQQHGSLAQFHRWHPEYGVDTLVSRALLMQFFRLLPEPSKDAKLLAKIMKRMGELDTSNPNKANAKGMFVKGLMAVIRSRHEMGGQGYDKSMKVLAQGLFKQHGRLWAQQSLTLKDALAQRARRYAAGKKELNLKEMDDLRVKKEKLVAGISEDDAKDKPLTLSAAALTDADVDLFSRLMVDESFCEPSRMHSTRAKALSTPETVATHEDPEIVKTLFLRRDPKHPPWARVIAYARDSLSGSAMVVRTPRKADEYFKIVYMVQSPVYIAICPLVPIEVVHEVARECDTLSEVCESYVASRWTCNYADMRSCADLMHLSKANISFILNVKMEGGIHVSSQWEPMHWDMILGGTEYPAKEEMDEGDGVDEGGAATSKGESIDDIVKDLPWLRHLDEKIGFHVRKARVHGPGDSEDIDPSVFDSAVPDEEEVLRAMSDMEKERCALALEAPVSVGDFVLAIRGREKATSTAAVGSDAVQGKARGKEVELWCQHRHLQTTFKATYSEYRSQEVCRTLVKGWAHRMQYFYDLAMASGNANAFEFGLGHISSYVEPVEFHNLARAPPSTKLEARIASVRRLPLSN